MTIGIERPTSLDHALALRASGCIPLAGATDIYPSLQTPLGKSSAKRELFVDVSALPELTRNYRDGGNLIMGAATPWSQIAAMKLPPQLQSLQHVAGEIGSTQIQNRGTIGGNLCNASPAADGVVALIALDAVAVLQSESRLRRLPVAEFVKGNRMTALEPSELLTSIEIPIASAASASAFLKLGGRRYLVISIVSAAAQVSVRDQRVSEVAIAVGACSAVPLRLACLENELRGCHASELDGILLEDRFFRELDPIDDVRATRSFRLQAAQTIVRRALSRCVEMIDVAQGASQGLAAP